MHITYRVKMSSFENFMQESSLEHEWNNFINTWFKFSKGLSKIIAHDQGSSSASNFTRTLAQNSGLQKRGHR